MKIIHTSDWHLGARFHEEERAGEHRQFLSWLLERIREEKPDALVVAGDIFDIKAPSPAAQEMYYGFLSAVARSGCCRKVVVTAGNHDNAHLLAAPAKVLDGIGVFVVAWAGEDPSGEVVVVDDASGRPGLVVGAVPFMYAAELANFGMDKEGEVPERGVKIARGWSRHHVSVLAQAKAMAGDAPVVLTGHCMLAEATRSDDDSERCRCVGGLDAYDPAPLAGADYVALGHLHRPQAVRGFEDRMFYSGSPLAMSFDEATGRKYINVVTFGKAGETPEVKQVEVPRTVEILTLRGKPEDVKGELAEAVSAGGDVRRFVRIQLEDFEGSATAHWSGIRELVKGSATRVLEEADVRPRTRDVGAPDAFKGKTIAQIKPREMAERKLRTSSQHYSEEQVAAFMRMFDEVAGGVR